VNKIAIPAGRQLSPVTHKTIREMEDKFLDGNKLNVRPHHWWLDYGLDNVQSFMWKHGMYVVPTRELSEWVSNNAVGRRVEIGCGNGAIGRDLSFPITDSKMHDSLEYRMYMLSLKQPPTEYPEDVVKMEATEAILHYGADTAFGCFITHRFDDATQSGNVYGPDTMGFLKLLKMYVMVGNLKTHRNEPLLKLSHEELQFPWLITRSADQSLNRIFVWKGSKP
jgi:hypothetical protein